MPSMAYYGDYCYTIRKVGIRTLPDMHGCYAILINPKLIIKAMPMSVLPVRWHLATNRSINSVSVWTWLLCNRRLNRYGRMRMSRCLTSNAGSVGCSRDVLPQIDSVCSGQRTCHLDVRDLLIHNPCAKDLRGYLEVRYTCLTGIAICCAAKRRRNKSYLLVFTPCKSETKVHKSAWMFWNCLPCFCTLRFVSFIYVV